MLQGHMMKITRLLWNTVFWKMKMHNLVGMKSDTEGTCTMLLDGHNTKHHILGHNLTL